MQLTKLSAQAIEAIRNNQQLKYEIIHRMQISESTLYRWLKENNIQLCDSRVVKTLLLRTQLTEAQIIQLSAAMRKHVKQTTAQPAA